MWQQVIKLVPDHSGAERGLADIENRWEEERGHENLERTQSVLLALYHEGKLPSDEFAQGMALLEKRHDDLPPMESKIQKLLDDLTDEKISVAIYLNSVRLLRKPAGAEKKTPMPEREPRFETKESTVMKSGPPAHTSELEETPNILVAFRKTPAELSDEQVKTMLVEKNFYDSSMNKDGKGIVHNYVAQTLHGDKVVLDKATGLMWQQSGSPNQIPCGEAEQYIRDLNNTSFAGFTNWRLPTLEEVMSLMEPQEKDGGLYINPIFDPKQQWVLTVDKYIKERAWSVHFDVGSCGFSDVGNSDVRAVRSV
ncbi:MAG: DUF1566 domain-containing protein [bacterium]